MKSNATKKFIKKILFTTTKNTQTGFTLLETLIAIGLLAVLMSISFITYRSISKNVAIKTLKQVSELFPIALTTCISSSGWKVTTPLGTDLYPCTDTDSAKAFDKIGYICPANTSPDDNTCQFVNNDTDGYVCLNILKTIKGKQYEIHMIINRNNSSDYKILCSDKDGNVTTPEGASNTICTAPSSSSYPECDW